MRRPAGHRCVVAAIAAVAVVGSLAGCTGSDASVDDASAVATTAEPAGDDAGGDLFVPSTAGDDGAGEGEMRPVPTVPPSTLAGQTDANPDDGVVEVAPTLVPGPATTSPDGEVAAPPSTELVGDPQPSPDTTMAPPPPTVVAPDPACDRLERVGVPAEIEGFVGTEPSATESAGGDGCRYSVAGGVVEVWFVPIAEVRDDWFRRTGVEPVAEAGGEAVGLDGFSSSDGSSGPGFTVAIAGGGQGAIVTLSGLEPAKAIAGFVAALSAQAA